MPGLLLAQRYATTEQPELHGIAAERGTRVFDFGALDETECHQTLDLRVRRVHRCDNALLAFPQRCERAAVVFHRLPVSGFSPSTEIRQRIM